MLNLTTVSNALEQARTRLSALSDTPALEAQVLLGAALARPKSWLLAHPEEPLPASAAELFEQWLQQRTRGVPLPYLLGEWEFYGRSFFVTPDVLIPRPETELLVALAVEWLRARQSPARVVDVGTGSGCIAVSIALAAPNVQIVGLDLSEPALRVARRNADRYGCEHIRLIESDLLDALPPDEGPVDLICANLPYIPTATLLALEVAAHEPRLALDGGREGLDLISRLLSQSDPLLAPDGKILLEIEAGQGESVPALARRRFPGAEVTCRKDLAGLPRVVQIERSKNSRCY